MRLAVKTPLFDSRFPCDISAFVTIQEAIMRLRTIGLKGDAATMGRIDDKKSLLSGLHS